jgi:hypothetical protein
MRPPLLAIFDFNINFNINFQRYCTGGGLTTPFARRMVLTMPLQTGSGMRPSLSTIFNINININTSIEVSVLLKGGGGPRSPGR